MNAGAFVAPRLFTVAEYYRMAGAGIFTEDDRVELIEGEILATGPIGSRHAAVVERTAALLRERLSGAMVRIQNPVRLSDHSEPEPDVVVVRTRDDFYAAGHPEPDDVLLLVEVADASVIYGRNTKAPLYARSGIRELWLVDLVANAVEVRSNPSASGYARTQRFERGAAVVSAQVPDLRIDAADILIG